ncbi:aminoglycoside phosphotransferase family protein [Phenylobacterium sp.]|uniref:aminoglycoside phosphotransferase family protein n=1 Tax=Phenylobacterium sp. TaxID=1871053 RepID=UPI002723C34A|nr:aminoglycoside phosphotransferase family protein [Phenylobacterium sp.]MDO8801929.1 aminoglycoside phosphotransferase family protein [Phenylobacterium sp.]
MSAPVRNATVGVPPAEVEISEALVRALLAAQHPDLAHLPITLAASGWDNDMFRLGDDLAVRMPRRLAGLALLRNEQRWLPTLPRLPLPIPTPLRLGVPGEGYPWPWSVLPWMPGGPADLDPLAAHQALVLAGFLKALHQPAPAQAPHNPHRGVPLAERLGYLTPRIDRLAAETGFITPRVREVWNRALATPIDVAPTWLHGDPHARNVLSQDGRLTAVIDWGDLCAGDRATDLSSLWMLLPDREARHAAMAAYHATDATWARAAGWAVNYAVVLVDAGRVNDARLLAMGAKTFAMVEAGD